MYGNAMHEDASGFAEPWRGSHEAPTASASASASGLQDESSLLALDLAGDGNQNGGAVPDAAAGNHAGGEQDPMFGVSVQSHALFSALLPPGMEEGSAGDGGPSDGAGGEGDSQQYSYNDGEAPLQQLPYAGEDTQAQQDPRHLPRPGPTAAQVALEMLTSTDMGDRVRRHRTIQRMYARLETEAYPFKRQAAPRWAPAARSFFAPASILVLLIRPQLSLHP